MENRSEVVARVGTLETFSLVSDQQRKCQTLPPKIHQYRKHQMLPDLGSGIDPQILAGVTPINVYILYCCSENLGANSPRGVKIK